uniref:Aquaporin-3 n=1 Tax=Eptatretus burgeri TaxID=7764 RepID=A0A8C4R448_EPTBU
MESCSKLADLLRDAAKMLNNLRTSNESIRLFMAELLATAMLVLIGCAAVAQGVLSGGGVAATLSINLAFGLAVMMSAHIAMGVSGAHMNPAVTLAMCILDRFPWKRLPLYWISQFLGAFIGALGVYALYHEGIQAYEGGELTVVGPHATAGIFATYPNSHLSTGGGVIDQVIGTAILLCLILALTDESNCAMPRYLQPLGFGLVVVAIGQATNFNCGYAINPARDLGPRIFSALVGYGSEVFWAKDCWWWVPVLAPLIGSVLGSLCYQLLIALHYPRSTDRENEKPPSLLQCNDHDNLDGSQVDKMSEVHEISEEL